jgi:hypothetical protein
VTPAGGPAAPTGGHATPAGESATPTGGYATLPLSGCSFGWLHLAPLPDALRALARQPEPRLPADLATLAAAGWTP